MWNGNPANHSDNETARRLSIEMALAQHTGVRSPSVAPPHYGYVPQSEYQRQLAMQSAMHHPHHHPAHHPPPHHHPAHHAAPPSHHHRPWDPPPPAHREAILQEPAATEMPQESNQADVAIIQPRGKPEAVAARLSTATPLQEKIENMEELEAEEGDTAAPETPVPTTTSSNAEAKKTDEKPTPKKRKRSLSPKKSSAAARALKNPAAPTMDDSVQPITVAEYENLQALMVQFCRVPLLAEFSRPVSLLHPELMSKYIKIVQHPMDLGKVCRKIRKKEYTCLRDVRLDAWRIFSNCVKYHYHPSNKDAVPSFVSIALHLRDYFNALWQEYMLPSDPPPAPAKPVKSGLQVQVREAMNKRREERKRRLMVSGLSVMTGKALERTCKALNALIENGGCVDRLDTERVWGEGNQDEDDLDVVVENLLRLKNRLSDIQLRGDEYGVDELDRDFRQCYTKDVLENNPAVRMRVANRLDRFIGKIVVPIHEATCRGVSQSSIWGCMAAAVWARESSKKPYWPALVLGIMAPDDQKEDWHLALTQRNETRLPEKLRTQLISGKRKSEQAVKRQNMGQIDPQSFFLVEFMGTHEFIWVRESDIVESFDPSEDPNENHGPGSKKKKTTRSNLEKVKGSKLYNSALEEGRWALEEFELQLQDIANDDATEEDDGEEMNYSYSVLCQSDEEADEAESEDEGDDIEECNELLATDGLIDFTTTGRKKAKRKALDMKKQKVDAEKKQKARVKAEQTKKKKELKKQEKDLEKKRKKRGRERERALKGSEQKLKRRRVSDSEDLKKAPSGRRNLIAGKQERATAIVQGYLKRTMERDEYKTLCLGASIGEGVLTIPASMIDSSGLVGLALAFRAAAGEIPMPSESGDQSSNIKPWDAIDVDEKKKAKDREELLLKQIDLLSKEIERVKSNTAKRMERTEEAKSQHIKMNEQVDAEDKTARQNPLKNKRKSLTPDKKGKEGASKSPTSKAEDGAKSEGRDAEMEVEVEAVESVEKTEAQTDKPDDAGDATIAKSVVAAVESSAKDSDDDESPAVAEAVSEENIE